MIHKSTSVQKDFNRVSWVAMQFDNTKKDHIPQSKKWNPNPESIHCKLSQTEINISFINMLSKKVIFFLQSW